MSSRRGLHLSQHSTRSIGSANDRTRRNSGDNSSQQLGRPSTATSVAGQKRPRRNKSAPTSGSGNAPSDSGPSLLIELSRCCQEHSTQHGTFGHYPDAHAAMPDDCRVALDTLKQILPKLEKKYRSSGKRTCPDPLEVVHLCCFYRDVLEGGFCPYAPAIFEVSHGIPDIHQVLPRVYDLYQHLISPKMIALVQESNNYSTTTTENSQNMHVSCRRPDTTWAVEKTIAYLLDFLVPSSFSSAHCTTGDPKQVIAAVEADLLQLLTDLAILSQSRHLVFGTKANDSNNENIRPHALVTTSNDESSSNTNNNMVQIQLFPQTANLAKSQPQAPEYLLDIPNHETVWSLQAATLNLWIRWNEFQRDRGFEITERTYDTGAVGTMDDDGHANYHTQRRQQQPPAMGLLAAMRPIFFCPEAGSLLSQRTQSAALEVLLHSGLVIPRPTAKALSVDVSVLLEAGLLTVHAIGETLKQQLQQQSTTCNDIVKHLSELLIRTVLVPPRVGGYREEETHTLVRQTVLGALLEDCLPWIQPTTPQGPTQQKQSATNSLRELPTMVLRAIHACLLTTKFVITNQVSVVAPLFALMSDSGWSDIVVWILAAVLESLPVDLESVCASCWAQRHQRPLSFLPDDQNPDCSPPSPVVSRIKSAQSPTPSTRKTSKGRKSTSVFDSDLAGDSPLTILASPVPAKKRRTDGVVNTMSSPATTPWSASWCFVDDLLQAFLEEALQAVQRLSGAELESPSNSNLMDIDRVSGAFRLLLCLIKGGEQDSHTGQTQANIFCNSPKTSASFTIMASLANSWQEWCSAIQIVAASGEWGEQWHAFGHKALNCGLHACYITPSAVDGGFSPVLRAIFRKGFVDCCSGLAHVANLVDEQDASTHKKLNCGAPFVNPTQFLEIGCGSFGSPLGGVAIVLGCPYRSFRRDFAMMQILSLPMSFRYCLLAALTKQPETAEHPDQIFGCRLSSVLTKIITEKLLNETPPAWNESISTALRLSPLALLASCLLPSSTKEEPGHWKTHLVQLMTGYLRIVLLPIIDALAPIGNAEAYTTIFAVVHSFQWLQFLLESSHEHSLMQQLARVLRDPWATLAFLRASSGDSSAQRTFDSTVVLQNGMHSFYPSDQKFRRCESIRREITFRLSSAALIAGSCENEVSEGKLRATWRMLRWKCVAWEVLRSRQCISLPELVWLLQAPFSDPDATVRTCTSRGVGKVICANRGHGLFVIFAQTGEWQMFFDDDDSGCINPFKMLPDETSSFTETNDIDSATRTRQRIASQRIVMAFFSEIDSSLEMMCENFYSQKNSLNCKDDASKHEEARVRAYRFSALQALSSICKHADPAMIYGRSILELSLLRIARLLTLADDANGAEQTFPPFEKFLISSCVPATSFGELACLSMSLSLEQLVVDRQMGKFLSGLFQGFFFPCTSVLEKSCYRDYREELEDITAPKREYRYRRLYSAIQIIVASSRGTLTATNVDDILAFFHKVLPILISELVLEESYACILLTTGFKLFLLGLQRSDEKFTKELHNPEAVVGSATAQNKVEGVSCTTEDLEEQTKMLVLTPGLIEPLLASVFMNANKSQLTFFRLKVLRDSLSLKTCIEGRDQLTLKALVTNLGLNPDRIGSAMHGIRAAAIARNQTTPHTESPCDRETDAQLSNSFQADAPTDLASKWVTSRFMYLLVNVCQFQWKARSTMERLNAMWSLNGMLAFLLPAEAAQYFPQMMATVNAAIEEGTPEDRLSLGSLRIRHLAVQALAKFSRIVEKHSWEGLASNLTNMVVALIPILTASDDDVAHCDTTETSVSRATEKVAVNFLEWLTQKPLGDKLAKYFQEIPFLPISPKLDGVRKSLKAIGVDFDNLSTSTEPGPQQGTSGAKEGVQSDGASVSLDAGRSGIEEQDALKRRIETVSELLGNENKSTRKVALQHLVKLLRANRSLFQTLIENEGVTDARRFLTTAYPACPNIAGGFSITKMMEMLLARCVREVDLETRTLLGIVLGEVGAIGDHRLGSIRMSDSLGISDSLDSNDSTWRLSRLPHISQKAEYGFQLVSKHLVAGLKAAPSSSDQHKIAFAIQQLLELLDKSPQSGGDVSPAQGTHSRPQMSQKLKVKLEKAGVFETIEPYWNSEFHETRTDSGALAPPFFRNASTYYSWLSGWCRFMIEGSKCSRSPWNDLFDACRPALRSPVGLGVAEFIVPLLVLDCFCNGNAYQQETSLQEMQSVLNFEEGARESLAPIAHTERRKAVNCAIMVCDTLEYWAEQVVEDRYKRSKSTTKSMSRSKLEPERKSLSDDSCYKIEEMSEKIPLLLRAKAAARVGMHARALRLLEMAGRQVLADEIYNTMEDGEKSRAPQADSERRWSLVAGPENLRFVKDVLVKLNDCETVAALDEDNTSAKPLERTLDSIRHAEASGDWDRALRDYERAQQLHHATGADMQEQLGILRCLLELGQFESVLKQVKGMTHSTSKNEVCRGRKPGVTNAIPFAVEAAWRLGRWDTLDDLLNHGELGSKSRRSLDSEGIYQTSQGEAFLCLQKKLPQGTVLGAIGGARQAVMDRLSIVARESYARAYPLIVKLQCLREMEDTTPCLCENERDGSMAFSEARDCLGWNRRLQVIAPSGAAAVINTRLALARLAGDAHLEVALFVEVGKKARKSGLFGIAADSFAQAEASFESIRQTNDEKNRVEDFEGTMKMQLAKLKHDFGQRTTALKILGEDKCQSLLQLNDASTESKLRAVLSEEKRLLGTAAFVLSDDAIIKRYTQRALQSTQWMVEGGLKDGAEIKSRFQLICDVSPKSERAHFQFAKYLDAVVQSRTRLEKSSRSSYDVDEDEVRANTIFNDKTCQENIVLAIKHYGEALAIRDTTKHVFQALPRLLSLWCDFTAILVPGKRGSGSAVKPSKPNAKGNYGFTAYSEEDLKESMRKKQLEANHKMAELYQRIQPQIFYTAMPQLIAQVMHSDKSTADVVRAILRRVLTKFPGQAMWSLAWLRQSKNEKRNTVGNDIFTQAHKALSRRNPKLSKLLIASRGLIQHLHDVAKYEVKGHGHRSKPVILRPWRGEIALTEFIPPVQAALTGTLIRSSDASKDFFPRQVPRMRDFCSVIEVMSSKARPKKVKVFVVPEGRTYVATADFKECQEPKSCDIGEIHFLVKQEAKGDLRKDARVQDLNNVINRLMAQRKGRGPSALQQRRLQLRTFAVTCLTEESGILEWVKDTTALRNIIKSTYNPQASEFSSRRRGDRMVDFLDQHMRAQYQSKCQDAYFNDGNLTRAAKLFDQLCLKPNPPLLYWWFVQNFHDPHAWYEARTLFTLSTAAFSAVGHCIGLGDRHSENILVETTSAEVVHVDFDCIFDKGLHLPQPEVVPFRLTHNIVDAFGPTGVDGMYRESLKTAMTTLRDNRDTLLSVLEPFIKDPIIDWKRSRGNTPQKSSLHLARDDYTQRAAADEQQTREAKRSVRVIAQRLQGIYNLRNPNVKKIRRTDLSTSLTDDVDENETNLLPLSVEGQVEKMISEATSSKNLVQLYVGWMPWV